MTKTLTNSKEWLDDALSFINNRLGAKEADGFFIGIDSVDAATEGVRPGQLITIADAPECLMSLFSQFIENISVNQKTPGLLYTTRTSIRRMSVLLLSYFSKVPYTRMISGKPKYEDINTMLNNAAQLYESSLYIQYNPVANWETLRKDILYHINENNIKMVFLENLTPLINNENDELELFILIKVIKEFAIEKEITIFINFLQKENLYNEKIFAVLSLESDIFLHLTENRVLKNKRFREYKLEAKNESLCIHNKSLITYDVFLRRFIREESLNQNLLKDINSYDSSKEIRYLLNLLFSCYDMSETCMDNDQKKHIAEIHHSLLTKLKLFPDINIAFKYCTALGDFKSEIELGLETIEKIYSDSNKFNIAEEEIKEVEKLLNRYLDAIYEEIANDLVDDKTEDTMSLSP